MNKLRSLAGKERRTSWMRQGLKRMTDESNRELRKTVRGNEESRWKKIFYREDAKSAK